MREQKKCGRSTANRASGANVRVREALDVNIGLKLRARRFELGLTKTAVANGIGVTLRQVTKYENGDDRISPVRLNALSRLLGVPVSWFFEAGRRPQDLEVRDLAVLDNRLLRAFRQIETRSDQMRLVDLAERMADPLGRPLRAVVTIKR